MIQVFLDKSRISGPCYEVSYCGETYYTPNEPITVDTTDTKVLFTGQLNGAEGKDRALIAHLLKKSNGNEDKFIELCRVLNGEWAMVIIIPDQDMSALFTDPLGTIPIYFNKELEISTNNSEISDHEQFDPVYRSEVLKWGYNTDNRTPWEDVKRVMPRKLTYFIDNENMKTYFERPIFEDFFNYDNTNFSVRDVMHNVILKQLKDIDINREIAVLLSGGLDSSIISYELITINKKVYDGKLRLHFYTLNEDPKDVECTKAFCEMYGITTTFISYDKSNVDYEKALRINKTPIDLGSMVPNQILFSQIPEKLYFTGDGADCIFGGFRRIDEYDSQMSDLFEEHPFYYSPKGNNACEHFNTQLKCPFNDFEIVNYALHLPLPERTHKKCLKDAYRDVLPDCIINRQKLPLKTEQIVKDKNQYRYDLAKKFYSIDWKK